MSEFLKEVLKTIFGIFPTLISIWKEKRKKLKPPLKQENQSPSPPVVSLSDIYSSGDTNITILNQYFPASPAQTDKFETDDAGNVRDKPKLTS